jgi:hypothetical protein
MRYWQGHCQVSGTIYYDPANPPKDEHIWSDGTIVPGSVDFGLESWEQTLGTHAVNGGFTSSAGAPSTSSAYPTAFELIVPGSPGSGTTYTFIWTLTGT